MPVWERQKMKATSRRSTLFSRADLEAWRNRGRPIKRAGGLVKNQSRSPGTMAPLSVINDIREDTRMLESDLLQSLFNNSFAAGWSRGFQLTRSISPMIAPTDFSALSMHQGAAWADHACMLNDRMKRLLDHE